MRKVLFTIFKFSILNIATINFVTRSSKLQPLKVLIGIGCTGLAFIHHSAASPAVTPTEPSPENLENASENPNNGGRSNHQQTEIRPSRKLPVGLHAEEPQQSKGIRKSDSGIPRKKDPKKTGFVTTEGAFEDHFSGSEKSEGELPSTASGKRRSQRD